VTLEYSRRTRPDDLLAVLSALLAAGGTFVRGGSGALALCYVACGRTLGFVELHMQSWDCLAALRVVEEAGGRCNGYLVGEALLAGGLVVAGAPGVYEQIVALLPDPGGIR
jgi:myo-inositol-1(or 4)-monophosphatase